MRVPLSLLTSEGFAECPTAFANRASVTEFQQFLNNHDQPITGIVAPQELDDILEELEITRPRFRQTLINPPCVNNKYKIDCLLGQHCLGQARRLLGDSYECTVRIYAIPPELPDKYSHGEICRQALLHDKTPSLYRQWLERLPPGKAKHMSMIFLRSEIWSAMKDMASLPGLWEDIKLGNWAKHLAAHVDELIVVYWRDHMRKIWDEIFEGLEDQQCYLDPYTARFVQFKSPARSRTDRRAIRDEMAKGSLFPNIADQAQRDKLLDNIVKIKAIIPSILTFHENMRYLTTGARILANHIEVKRRKRRRGRPSTFPRPPESLVENLGRDWKWVGNYAEVREGHYLTMHEPLDEKGAFVQLILMALRLFPFLGSVPPLQDVKGDGMDAFIDDSYKRRLCIGALCLGYRNWKILEGIELSSPELPRTIPKGYSFSETTSGWRGGMPTISVFQKLRKCSFLPSLEGAAQEPAQSEPDPLLVKADFVHAFFGHCRLSVDQSRPVVDSATVLQQLKAVESNTNDMDGLESHQEQLAGAESLNDDMDGLESHQGQQRRKNPPPGRTPKNPPPGRAPKDQGHKHLKQATMKHAAASVAGPSRRDPAEIKRMAASSKTQPKKNTKSKARPQARTLLSEERLEAELESHRLEDQEMLPLVVPHVQQPMPSTMVPDDMYIGRSAAGASEAVQGDRGELLHQQTENNTSVPTVAGVQHPTLPVPEPAPQASPMWNIEEGQASNRIPGDTPMENRIASTKNPVPNQWELAGHAQAGPEPEYFYLEYDDLEVPNRRNSPATAPDPGYESEL
ncbi:hypothetical protein NCS52_01027000 [Fusarium sp. LHS14.1]|nr:hypothetical protein NCS52_01027000 [Fusarium sp. LHS14.1]